MACDNTVHLMGNEAQTCRHCFGSSLCALSMDSVQPNHTFKASFQTWEQYSCTAAANVFRSFFKMPQEKRMNSFHCVQGGTEKCMWTYFIETTNTFIGWCEIHGDTWAKKNIFFFLHLLVAAFFQANKSFDNDDLLEVSIIMTCKSFP